MTLINELEQFYNERLKRDGDPEFKELPPDLIDRLRNTTIFAVWRMDKACKGVRESLLQFAQEMRDKAVPAFKRLTQALTNLKRK